MMQELATIEYVVAQAETSLSERWKQNATREVVLAKEHVSGLRDFVGTLINPANKGTIQFGRLDVTDELEDLHRRLNRAILWGVQNGNNRLPLVVYGSDVQILSDVIESKRLNLEETIRYARSNVRGLQSRYRKAKNIDSKSEDLMR